MNNFYTLLASKKIRIDDNGDVIYHTTERCGNGFRGDDVNLSEELRAMRDIGYEGSIESLIKTYQFFDYDPCKDWVGSD